MKAFKINICVPGFCYFRKPTNTAYLDTYSVPPTTTVIGLISNALGLARGDYRLQDEIKIALRNNKGNMMEEYAQLLKEPKSYFPEYMYNKDEYEHYLRTKLLTKTYEEISSEDLLKKVKKTIDDNGYKKRNRVLEYSTSPMKRRVIVDADFTIYIASENDSLLDKIRERLFSPQRPLYLGASDSIADVYGISEVVPIQAADSDVVNTICTGIHSGGSLVKFPCRFEELNKKVNVIYSPIITVFEQYPVNIGHNKSLHKFGDEYICLI